MKTDALARRRRTVSQSSGKGVQITPGVLRVLRALYRYSPLPTGILWGFWRGGKPSWYAYFQDRMKHLYHETEGGGPFVEKPGDLNPSFGPQYEPNWYVLSPAGFEHAKSDAVMPKKRDPWHHRAMGACVEASFELLAPEYDLQYRNLEDILLHRDCPEDARIGGNPLSVKTPAGWLELDALGGFNYLQEGKVIGFRSFAMEHDRATERFKAKSNAQDTIEAKIVRYQSLFTSRLYRDKWGFPSHKMRVLFITTAPGRIKNCLDYLRGKPHADRFLFKALPEFGTDRWRAPREPLRELFTPWHSVDGLVDITKP